jgi:hypothetical protein
MLTMPAIRPMTDEDVSFVVTLNEELEWAAAPMDAHRRGHFERGRQRMPDGHEVVLLEKPL